MKLSRQFLALSREAGLAAELVASGLTEIRRADYAQTGVYAHAFFSLSIGLERILKLVLIMDYMLECGALPDNKHIESKGHDIKKLVDVAIDINKSRSLKLTYNFPDDEIVHAIISVLTDFARATRYYNLDYLTGRATAALGDPLAVWVEKVGALLIARHYPAAVQEKKSAQAARLAAALEPYASVQFTSEEGVPITEVRTMLEHSSRAEVLQKWGQFHCFRIVRHFTEMLSELGHEAEKSNIDVPHFGDFFRIFYNPDAYVKSRKTWKPI